MISSQCDGSESSLSSISRCRYFRAANPSSTQRHLYSIPLPTTEEEVEAASKIEPKSLTDVKSAGYYDASFSPQGGFYLLTYGGPNAPWQNILKTSDSRMRAIPFRILQYTDVMACIDFIRPFTENGALNDTLLQYELPVVSYSTIESDGYGTSITRITDVLNVFTIWQN